MPSKGKAKGNSWERELAGILNKIFNLPFQRVPNSGAFLGGSNASRRMGMDAKQERLMTGDLIVPEELNHCSFECKFYKTFDYHLLYRQNKQFEEWIKQAKEGCNLDQIWFLCIKSNRREPLVVTESVFLYDIVSKLNFTSYRFEKSYVYVTELKPFFELSKDCLLSISRNTVSL
jgi:hypothetical protein